MSQHNEFMHFMETIELRQQVRYGNQLDRGDLFLEWFKHEEVAFSRCCNCVRRRVFQREIDLLTEAIADELVPEIWREQCLAQARRPVNGLARIAKTRVHWQAVHRAQAELKALEDYSLEYLV